MDTALPPIPPNIFQLTTPLVFSYAPGYLQQLTKYQLLGSFINFTLYGVLLLQVYIYIISFPNDDKKFQGLVGTLFILETAQVGLCAADIYYWFASGYGNMKHLGGTHFSPFDTPMLGSVVALIVQLFFCHRITILKQGYAWRGLVVLIVLISLTQAVGGVMGGVQAHLSKGFAGAHEHIEGLYMWLVGGASADLLIAATLAIILLNAAKNNESQKWTRSVLERLVRMTMETNFLTAGMAFLSIILFIVLPNNTYFVCPTMFIAKLYSNSLLATLNNRLILSRDLHKGNNSSSFQERFASSLKHRAHGSSVSTRVFRPHPNSYCHTCESSQISYSSTPSLPSQYYPQAWV